MKYLKLIVWALFRTIIVPIKRAAIYIMEDERNAKREIQLATETLLRLQKQEDDRKLKRFLE